MGSTLRIIVADDDEAIRGLIVRIVERILPDAQIATAADGTEVLDIYLAQGADLLITDQLMPLLNGLDMVARLRAQGETVPALVISAVVPARAELHRLGNIAYVAKPFEVIQVEAAIAQLLSLPPTRGGSGDAKPDDHTSARGPTSYSPTALADEAPMSALTTLSSFAPSSGPGRSVQ